MSGIASAARTAAKIGVEKGGGTFTYIRVGEGTTDLSTGTVTPSEEEKTLTGAFTNINLRLVDGSKVRLTDEMVLVDAISFEAAYGVGAVPSTDDRVRDGTETLSIVRVIKIRAGTLYAAHKLVVRR